MATGFESFTTDELHAILDDISEYGQDISYPVDAAAIHKEIFIREAQAGDPT